MYLQKLLKFRDGRILIHILEFLEHNLNQCKINIKVWMNWYTALELTWLSVKNEANHKLKVSHCEILSNKFIKA